ncbi:ABC transporter ATP-binding protein [Marinilactibacillus psychrotolerans]|uniref:Multidrug ABC transporter ATP-binding and permease protein n=1 Tax=Marinilactibacillus psychrotolerans TaxID=191770 RepID=A0AAV3WTY8_9LACT|nr:ABC transporter ATP-binding protein [Marinilactibacillus psychrotolerans]GEL67893.1 ABC transporter ATP-binding protein [Marinilactibacillus psychrotolerans]GEQ36113.1 multidrug ABC transporter ATP-binding and permease protein [Marinilactibacillus psychrotolerans]SDC64282.1 ATP-binding cassette, subfamily B [Marinilactibacillus psychrotolerans]
MEQPEIIKDRSIPFKQQMHILRRILKFAHPYRKEFTVAIIFSILLAIINAILPRIIQVFIDDHITPGDATLRIILFFAALHFGVTLIRMIVWYFELYIFNMASEKTVKNIRESLYTKLHSLGMRFFDQTSTGWIITRATNDTEAMKDFWNVFLTIMQGVFGVVISLSAMFILDASVAVWILLFAPVLLIVIRFYQVYSSKTYVSMKSKLSSLNTKLAETINGMSIIQQFRQERRLQKEFEETNRSYFDSRYSMVRINAILLSPIINFLYTIAVVLILAIFGINALNSPIEVGIIYAFTSYANDFFRPLTRLMDSLSLFQDGIVSSSRILKVMDNEEYTPQQNNIAGAEIEIGKIEFKNVSFSYDGKSDVLKNISFNVNPGETVALVGHTGSGKSSIINVLMRFYDFQKGEVLIDGRSIKDYPMRELRRKTGLVLQDSFLFYGTIKDNIRIKNNEINDREIIQAARFVQADQFIEDLPGDYDARVVERGASFSSGQKQLISFASTIVRDPKILILDEATANIDTETEALIQEGLNRMRKGRTTVAIAHRLSTIRDADQILVLEDGRIIERGTHDDLISKGGKYKDMYELQNIGLQTK